MSDRRLRWALVVAGVVGALHALAYVPVVAPEVPDSAAYQAAARSLLRGGYTTPIRASALYAGDDTVVDRTGLSLPEAVWDAPEPQAMRPPGYPAFLALFGGGAGAWRLLALVAQALLLGAAGSLLGATFARVAGAWPGVLAAAAFALDPYSHHYAALVLSEALAGFLVVACAYVSVRAHQERSVHVWAAAGAVAGVLTLTRPLLGLAIPFVVVGAALSLRSARAPAIAAALAAIAVVPWMAWTASAVGAPVLASAPQGAALLYGAHGASPWGRPIAEVLNSRAFIDDLQSVHPTAPSAAEILAEPEAHARYLRRSDARYRQLALDLYRQRLAEEPLQVAKEAAGRGIAIWRGAASWAEVEARAALPARLVDAAVLVLAIAGAVVLVRRGGPALGLVLFASVYTLAVLPLNPEGRFGIPLRGLLVAFAVLPLARVAARLDSPR